jgi:hypothetical protein
MELTEKKEFADFSILREGEGAARWSRAQLAEKKCSLGDQKRAVECTLNCARERKMEIPVKNLSTTAKKGLRALKKANKVDSLVT